MKLKRNRLLFCILLCVFWLILFPKKSLAGYQTLNNLDFQIDIKENGNMCITEIWNIRIEDTNTLFKTFPVEDAYDGISNVSVVEIEKNMNEKNFEKINQYMYHVTEDCFQALKNPDGDFEIAWGVNVTGEETRTFKISYTVLNNIVKYNDCAELYWKLIGNNFEIPVRNITGTIHLPSGITNIEDLKVWAHGPLNGTINKVNENLVNFNVNNLSIGTFLEIRLAMPRNIFKLSNKVINEDKLNKIISEETSYAEEANLKRERLAAQKRIMKNLACVAQCIFIIFMLFKMYKNLNKLKETPKMKPEYEFEYFRDIPDEEATPSEAGFLYYFNRGGISYSIGKIISATMLNLSLKGWIEFRENTEKRNDVNIVLKEGKGYLLEDERKLYEFLKKAAKNNESFSIKEFEKYSKKHAESFNQMLESISLIAEEKNQNKGNFSKESKKEHENITFSIFGYVLFILLDIIISFFNIPLFLMVLALTIINIMILVKLSIRISGLTQNGIDYKEKWEGLKKYMENFSMIDEKAVPELVLWEKYLVYATAFGIADKVIKQLKIKFPELENREYMINNFAYMYMICDSNNNFNFIDTISSSIGSATNYSSGSGAGGGFSGGGGGRRWWWRRWWSINIIQKNTSTKYKCKFMSNIVEF